MYQPVKLPKLLAVIIYDSLITLTLTISATSLLFLTLTLLGIPYPKPQSTAFRLFLLAVIFGYYHVCWAYLPNSQTIGMRAWNIVLVNFKQHNETVNCGPRINLFQSGMRILGGSLGFFSLGLGYILLYCNKDHKTLADYLSNSQCQSWCQTKV